MSDSEFHHYTRDEFLSEFYPIPPTRPISPPGWSSGSLEIIADLGDQRLAFTEPGTKAA